MKKIVSIMLLVMLISLSGATSQDSPGKKLEMNLDNSQMNKITDHTNSANMIAIKDNSFQPFSLTVPAGTTVTWHNQDTVPHTISSDTQGLFESGQLAPGKKYAINFSVPGSYKYHCSIHSGMQGLIVVSGAIAEKTSFSQETRLVSNPSLAKGSSQGSDGEDSGSASWNEKPFSLNGQVMSAGADSSGNKIAPVSTVMQPVSYKGFDQSSIQTSGQSDLQQFSQYYRTTSEVPKDQITVLTKTEINGEEPAMLYFGSTQKAVPYSQYKTYTSTTGANSLWIRGDNSWTQYAMVPQGSVLNMITTSPAGGYGNLYEIYPDGTLDKNSYYFYPYNQVSFYADKVGQHQLFFNIEGQPSNVIVIDVEAYQPPAQPFYDYAAITISSSWLRGYDIYVDGSYQAKEGTTGEPTGTVTINVPGNQYHNIAIDSNGFTFSDNKYFNAGYAYSLNL